MPTGQALRRHPKRSGLIRLAVAFVLGGVHAVAGMRRTAAE